MTHTQMVLTFAVVVLATVLTRFLPYILFPQNRPIPKYISYLGKVLAPAVFGFLVVYCFRNVKLTTSPYGIPELIGVLIVLFSFLWKRSMFLSMILGTAAYMIILYVFF